MSPRFHLLYSLTIALIWAGFWWRSSAVHSDWRNSAPKLDQVNLKQVQSANHSSLFQTWKIYGDDPYSATGIYFNRASTVNTTMRSAMDTISSLTLPAFWEKRNTYFQFLAKNCDYDKKVSEEINRLWLISDKNDQRFATLFRSNPEVALNSFKLQLALVESITGTYYLTRFGVSIDGFDKFIPVILDENTFLINEKIQIPIVLPDFRGNYRWLSSPGFPPIRNGVIDTTLTFNSPGIQRIPFLIRYEDMETATIHEVHDTLSFRVYAQ